MAFIDFKKAFDFVGYPAIVQACQRWGLGPKYVDKIFCVATTTVDGVQVTPRIGVMQGSPLSPLLFTLTLDWALSAATQEVSVAIDGTLFQYLALADDVVLLATSPVGLRRNVGAVTTEAGCLSLEVGHMKCATLAIAADKKRRKWVQSKIELQVGGQAIRALTPRKFYKYLGVQVGSTEWAEEPSRLLARLVTGLGRLQRSPTKPQQKMWMLVHTLLAKLIYPLLHSETRDDTLTRLDREVRKFTRKAFHLPHDTPVRYFHASVRDGGLEIFFCSRIPRLKSDLLSRLSRLSPDSAVRAAAEGTRCP